jgi:hypothetical protein
LWQYEPEWDAVHRVAPLLIDERERQIDARQYVLACRLIRPEELPACLEAAGLSRQSLAPIATTRSDMRSRRTESAISVDVGRRQHADRGVHPRHDKVCARMVTT